MGCSRFWGTFTNIISKFEMARPQGNNDFYEKYGFIGDFDLLSVRQQ